jgi:PAS domain S-box-containing protein
MGRRIRVHDWVSTPLGPLDRWPQSLRTAVEILLASDLPMNVYWGPDFITLYNDAAIPLHPRHPRALGAPARELYPEDWDSRIAAVFAGIRQGSGAVYQRDQLVCLQRGGGRLEEVSFDYSLSPVAREDGPVGGILLIAIETTAQKAAERALGAAASPGARAEEALRESEGWQAYLLELSEVLRPLADPVELQRAACKLLGERLPASRALYTEYLDGLDKAAIVAEYARARLPSLLGEYRITGYESVFDPLRLGKTLIMEDVFDSPEANAEVRARCSAAWVRSQLTVPLVRAGKTVATVTVTESEPRNWTAQEIALVRETAERTWAATQRAYADGALRKSEERLKKALSIETIGVVYFKLDGRILDANAAFARMCGYTREELRNTLYWRTLTPLEFRGATARAAWELAERGETKPYEKELLRKDGSRCWGLFAPTRLDGSSFSTSPSRSTSSSSAKTCWLPQSPPTRMPSEPTRPKKSSWRRSATSSGRRLRRYCCGRGRSGPAPCRSTI